MSKNLTINNLGAGYDQKIIIDNINFSAQSGETVVLMGPSGAGKSTLLLTILGIIKPFSGKVILNDKDITNLPIEERNIGYLPQDYGLFPHFNVFSNISYGLIVRGISAEKRLERTREMLKLVDLSEYVDRKIQDLSGGQKQRVGLARALAIKPDLLLLDEPLSNIDQITKFDVAKALKNLFRKLDIPIILVTHNYEDAFFLSEKLVILINGKIEQQGTVHSIKNEPKNDLIKRLISPFSYE